MEYTQAVEQASVLEADTLDTEYRLLAEYGGVVLAGKEMERGYGYQFVTWSRDQDGRGLSHACTPSAIAIRAAFCLRVK